MSDTQGEDAPLLGGTESPAHTVPPTSPSIAQQERTPLTDAMAAVEVSHDTFGIEEDAFESDRRQPSVSSDCDILPETLYASGGGPTSPSQERDESVSKKGANQPQNRAQQQRKRSLLTINNNDIHSPLVTVNHSADSVRTSNNCSSFNINNNSFKKNSSRTTSCSRHLNSSIPNDAVNISSVNSSHPMCNVESSDISSSSVPGPSGVVCSSNNSSADHRVVDDQNTGGDSRSSSSSDYSSIRTPCRRRSSDSDDVITIDYSPLKPKRPQHRCSNEGVTEEQDCGIVVIDSSPECEPSSCSNRAAHVEHIRQNSSCVKNGDVSCNGLTNGVTEVTVSVTPAPETSAKSSTINISNSKTLSNYCSSASASQDVATKVTFRIEGEEDEEENDNRAGYGCDWFIEIQPAPLLDPRMPHNFSRIPSSNKASFLSTTSSTASMPFCRICHLPDGDGIESLISPCRCAGTMKFIHHGCLMKWLEVSSSRSRQVPACELCNYQFQRRTKFRIRQCQFPSCSRLDKILHSVFLVCLLVMMACAAVTVVCFKQNGNPRVHRENTELTYSEVVTLTCGVLFFVSFFVAMYVEVKATDTLYRLCTSFFYINQTMHIYEYDKKKDLLSTATNAPV